MDREVSTPAARRSIDLRVYNSSWHIKDVYRDVYAAEKREQMQRVEKARQKQMKAWQTKQQTHPKLFYTDTLEQERIKHQSHQSIEEPLQPSQDEPFTRDRQA